MGLYQNCGRNWEGLDWWPLTAPWRYQPGDNSEWFGPPLGYISKLIIKNGVISKLGAETMGAGYPLTQKVDNQHSD